MLTSSFYCRTYPENTLFCFCQENGNSQLWTCSLKCGIFCYSISNKQLRLSFAVEKTQITFRASQCQSFSLLLPVAIKADIERTVGIFVRLLTAISHNILPIMLAWCFLAKAEDVKTV